MLPEKCHLLNTFKKCYQWNVKYFQTCYQKNVKYHQRKIPIHDSWENKKETQFIQYDLLRRRATYLHFKNNLCKTNTIQTCHKEHNESHVQASLGLTASYIY